MFEDSHVSYVNNKVSQIMKLVRAKDKAFLLTTHHRDFWVGRWLNRSSFYWKVTLQWMK
jgi:hypothetical protein